MKNANLHKQNFLFCIVFTASNSNEIDSILKLVFCDHRRLILWTLRSQTNCDPVRTGKLCFLLNDVQG